VSAPSNAAATLRTLVVDDEMGIRVGVARVLQRYTLRAADGEGEVGFTVEHAATGEEALAAIAAAPPDIILLDHKLPGIQGLDVLDRVNREHPDTLVVMITAYATIETAVSATKRGAFDFLAKPFTPEELKSTVYKVAKHLLLQREARRLAAEKRQIRFQFVSVLAHELKAPLAAVEGYLQVLRDGLVEPDTPRYQDVLARCSARIEGMRALILDLLDLTRIESGQKARCLAAIDLAALAARAVETALPAAAARGITLAVTGPSSLPLVGDAGELEIVLNNLVSNAVKYNRNGGSVTVALGRAGDEVSIAVTDTGIGMTADETDRLFGEFVRIKNERTRTILGTGLGLSIVRRLAALYGGDVRVASEPDRGSTFTVTLHAPAPPGNA